MVAKSFGRKAFNKKSPGRRVRFTHLGPTEGNIGHEGKSLK
jgi:hypothetical protein